MKITPSTRSLLFCTALLAIAGSAQAQISTRLSDTVSKGRGTINLLRNMSADQFQKQVSSSGNLFFAMDVNEDNSGNENRASAGVALERVELVVKTTTGDYKFTNFSTNTSAMLKSGGDDDGGKDSKSYYTLFGQAGSNDITSSTKSFDLNSFDDVISLKNVKFDGKVLSAQMDVRLLDTGDNRNANSSFFDYSGGYEDMALLSPEDAQILEKASIGMSGVPKTVTFAQETSVVPAADIVTAQTPPSAVDPIPAADPIPVVDSTPAADLPPAGDITPAAPPAAPLPPLSLIILLVAGLVAFNAIQKGNDYRDSPQ
jgi:hypothetical protein